MAQFRNISSDVRRVFYGVARPQSVEPEGTFDVDDVAVVSYASQKTIWEAVNQAEVDAILNPPDPDAEPPAPADNAPVVPPPDTAPVTATPSDDGTLPAPDADAIPATPVPPQVLQMQAAGESTVTTP